MGKMTQEEKEDFFKRNQARSERDIITNKGIPTPLGRETYYVKALPWKDCDKFDEAIKKAVLKFSSIMDVDLSPENLMDNVGDPKNESDDKNVLMKVVDIVFEIIQQDLLEIASAATKGVITMDKIIETEATRNDVIEIVLCAFKVNYSSIKNLLSLVKGMK
jgi:hypothetical protein